VRSFRLFFVGRTKEAYLKEGINLYLKRLVPYSKVEVVEVKEGSGDPSQVMAQEAERILAQLGPQAYVVVLDEAGSAKGSVELSELFQKLSLFGTSHLDFVVGGAWGIAPALKERANLKLSFSKFTFTHQMIRLLLVEQLYRAMTLVKGEKYHNP